MSYILDALRRAEAERERGAVPSLHTEQFPAMADDDDRPKRSTALIATVVVLALALAALLAWTVFGGRGPAQPAVVASGTVTSAAAGATTGAAAPLSPVAAPMPAALPALAATTPTSSASSAASAADSPPAPVKQERKRPAATKPQTNTVDTADARDRVYREAELPEAARRAMPKLAFGGSSYSSAASSRMVIWNGRVFHEGDTIATDVVLRRIDRKSAQLTVKGYRVDVPF